MNKFKKVIRFDVRYVLRSGSYMMTEHFISMFVGVSYGLLVANLLDPNQYGIYKYILALTGVVGAFTMTELGASLLRAVAKGFEGEWKKISRTQIKWSLPAVLIGLGIGLYYLLQGAYIFALVVVVATLLIPLQDLGALSLMYLSGKEMFNVRSRLAIARTIISTLLLAIVLYVVRDAEVQIIARYVIGAAGFLMILLFVATKYPPNQRMMKEAVSYGKHLSFIDIIQRVGAQVDKLIVFQFFGPLALASYSIALMPVQQIMSGKKVLRMLIAPRFSRYSFDTVHKNIYYKTLIMFLVSIVVTVVYISCAPILFKYLLPQYTDMVFMTQIVALTLVTTPQALFGQVLVAHSCKRELYLGVVVQNISFLMCLIIGGFVGGVLGMVIGFVVSRFINMIVTYVSYLYAYNRYKTTQ